jgi:hypothetical protein
VTALATSNGDALLPVVRAGELDPPPAADRWLVDQLWPRSAVGVIGGRPKCSKTWLGLDLALSVASATPCLGHFCVDDPGPTLVYLAEDALGAVRERLEGLCRHRGLDLAALDLYVITAATLRLDSPGDRKKLDATVARVRPKLLLLDPLVRLHALDENSSGDVSRLLGFLRELQRRHSVAVVLVHHMSKRPSSDLGQALRGSSDVHAWTDASLYLTRSRPGAGGQLVLTVEHRSAAAPAPVDLDLVTDTGSPHLEVVSGAAPDDLSSSAVPLDHRIVEVLETASTPLRRGELRERLGINNQRLGQALADLELRGHVDRTPLGWTSRDALAEQRSVPPAP